MPNATHDKFKNAKIPKISIFSTFYIFFTYFLCKDHKIIIKWDKIASKGQNQDYISVENLWTKGLGKKKQNTKHELVHTIGLK